MRLFSRGEPFSHVRSEGCIPQDWAIEEMLEDSRNRDFPAPVFSEVFLYPRVGKDDARFILGIAEEYEAIIEELGVDEVNAVLERHRRRHK